MEAVLGIDIAKAKFQVALLLADGKVRHKTFLNAATGFQLAEWLRRQTVGGVHACLEATGAYGDALATWLHDAGHRVSIVNPTIIHAYARTQLARSKTDRLDAELIARFTATHQPPPWTPPPRDPSAAGPRAPSRRVARHAHAGDERLAAGVPVTAVRTSIEAILASLEAQIAHVQQLIRDHLDQHPGLRATRLARRRFRASARPRRPC